MKTRMLKTLILLSLFSAFPLAQSVCFAQQPVRRAANATAQAVAETMARLGKVGHFGGNPYQYEGCGMAMTREGAYRACCYANSGMKTVDVGYAQDSRGRWYCCRRYSR
jgi:hypothetical protein